ncbi:MAG: RNA helicase, partial [Nitriliruptoraceae bacterium]
SRGNPRQSEYRKQLAAVLRGLDPPQREDAVAAPDAAGDEASRHGMSAEVEALRARLRAHPCHACPDRAEHERWQHRADELLEQAGRLREEVRRATGSLVRQLHRILSVLGDLGYVDDRPAPTEQGLMLAGVYSEVDLLVAESLRRGLLDDLDAEELAGLAALFLYEPRGGEPSTRVVLPTFGLEQATESVLELADELRGLERAAGLRSALRELDAGFVAAAYRWAAGADLDQALGTLELTGGDFVRMIKQIADLLGQLRSVGHEPVAARAHTAVDALRRGIVEA